MSSIHKIIGTATLGVALLYGIPAAAASNENRGDRRSRSEILEATYSGPEEVMPSTPPTTSYDSPIDFKSGGRGNHNK